MHDLFNQAVDLSEKGELAGAEGLCLKLLRAQPDHFECLHLLGLLRYRRGRLMEAVSSLAAAVKANPGSPIALMNYAVVLDALGRPGEALASYDRALAIKPDYVDALYNRGLALRALNRPDDALSSFNKASALRPDDADILNERGRTLRSLDRPADALVSYEKALALRPEDADILNNRGNALRELDRLDEALASFDKALVLRPGYIEALKNRGSTLRKLKRPAEAIASYDRALTINPNDADAHYNRGNALADLNRPAEALASYDRALSIKPQSAEALHNRGSALLALKRPAEALSSLEKALTVKPDDAETNWNRSCVQLLLSDFDRGWKGYEWRSKTQQSAVWRRHFDQPLWLGEERLEGRTILLHAEQGFGDTIQFVRYVPLVAAIAARVILEVQPPLKTLTSGMGGTSLVIGRGEELPQFDFHCPLLSLPLAFKTRIETIPATTPYLSAPGDRVVKWHNRLRKSGMPRIGLAWAGSPRFKAGQTPSIGLTRLLPVLMTTGAEFLSLQKDLQDGDRDILRNNSHIMHLGDAIEDFSDTAAIMSLLDLVISSDTSIVHLAGALGRPVWVLLQYAAEWRWLLDRTDSPWYPTARLFRQPKIGDWEGVVQQVQLELIRLISAP
jgi:tetratricopeptide (TPR) repeat protein